MAHSLRVFSASSPLITKSSDSVSEVSVVSVLMEEVGSKFYVGCFEEKMGVLLEKKRI